MHREASGEVGDPVRSSQASLVEHPGALAEHRSDADGHTTVTTHLGGCCADQRGDQVLPASTDGGPRRRQRNEEHGNHPAQLRLIWLVPGRLEIGKHCCDDAGQHRGKHRAQVVPAAVLPGDDKRGDCPVVGRPRPDWNTWQGGRRSHAVRHDGQALRTEGAHAHPSGPAPGAGRRHDQIGERGNPAHDAHTASIACEASAGRRTTSPVDDGRPAQPVDDRRQPTSGWSEGMTAVGPGSAWHRLPSHVEHVHPAQPGITGHRASSTGTQLTPARVSTLPSAAHT